MPIANLLQPMVFDIHCPVNKLQGNRHLVFMTGGKHKVPINLKTCSRQRLGTTLSRCLPFRLTRVEKNLAGKGVNVAAFSKSGKQNYNFKRHSVTSTGVYTSHHQQFAHLEGVKEAQTLLEQYAPKITVECLRKKDAWEKP